MILTGAQNAAIVAESISFLPVSPFRPDYYVNVICISIAGSAAAKPPQPGDLEFAGRNESNAAHRLTFVRALM